MNYVIKKDLHDTCIQVDMILMTGKWCMKEEMFVDNYKYSSLSKKVNTKVETSLNEFVKFLIKKIQKIMAFLLGIIIDTFFHTDLRF